MPKADYRAAGHRLRVTRLTLGITEFGSRGGARCHLADLSEVGGGPPATWDEVTVPAFAEKYNVSLDWLSAGEGLGLRHHLSAKTSGKLAILPTMSAWRRALLAKPPQWPA